VELGKLKSSFVKLFTMLHKKYVCISWQLSPEWSRRPLLRGDGAAVAAANKRHENEPIKCHDSESSNSSEA
jgi:hypothetical protein